MDTPLISHPNVARDADVYDEAHLTASGHLRLDAHGRVVGDRARRLFGSADETARYVHTAALLHDFGKATPQFQAHVRPSEEYNGHERAKAHARLGALVTWYSLGELEAPPKDRLAATLAVARHHQSLPHTTQYTAETLADSFEGPDEILTAQLQGIDEAWPNAATELLKDIPATNVTWEAFDQWARTGNAASELRELSTSRQGFSREPDSSELPTQLYDRMVHYWSTITLADKSHAIEVTEDRLFEFNTLDIEPIENYISTIRATESVDEHEQTLNDDRERARRQAIRGVHDWLGATDSSDIATLTLPTGLGKTFTGLSAAFEARTILHHRETVDSDGPLPIIYALPYTSIIEQTRELFEDETLWGADPTKSALTVHHSLSDTVVYADQHTTDDVDDSDAEEIASLLGEAWRDGTILTTFVQLFESLAGPSNRQGLKLPSLESAVIILDEPQALPKRWWDGIERLLEIVTDEYGAHVIAMTATQPSLVREIDTTSLLSTGHDHNPSRCQWCDQRPSYPDTLDSVPTERYFGKANRVRYTVDESALSNRRGADATHVGYDEAAERLSDAVGDAGSVLAICNTIGSSQALTESICSESAVTHLGPLLGTRLESLGSEVLNRTASVSAVAADVLRAVGVNPPASVETANDSAWSVPDDVGTLVLTLNSRYRPFDRRVLVRLADWLSTSPVPFVLVSTQAVEAGVDISFEQVYRDIAPLDSIVQAAGRCNRSYEWGPGGGEVVVWMLAPTSADSSNPPAHWVYENQTGSDGVAEHLRIISQVLSELPDRTGVPDVEFSKRAVDTYFERISEKSFSNDEIRTMIDDADASQLARQSLIGDYDTVDVLVAVTREEKQELGRITDSLGQNPELYGRLDEFSNIRVSAPAALIEEAPQISRIDGKARGESGLQLFVYTGGGGLAYNLAEGGLQSSDEGVGGRFTV